MQSLSETRTEQTLRPVELRKKSMCSRIVLWSLGIAVCILGLLFIAQIIVVAIGITSPIYLPSIIIDGKYVNAVTSCGLIQGFVDNGSFSFLGVPYAIPPVGIRRWKVSETHYDLKQCWNGTYKALERRKACWQFYRNGSYDGSEDCLYLDVFTPKLHYDSPLPVVVYLAGESLDGGVTFDIQPTPTLARETNCVFVSASVRRSVLGFLSMNILSRSSPSMTSGNYGLSDALTVLKWVKYNVRHFGGNPDKVTLLGHQSGSTLIAALLKTEFQNDLFHHVWLSGGSVSTDIINPEVADKQNQVFIDYTGCQSADCLYNTSPEELLESVPYEWRTFHHELPTMLTNMTDHQWLVSDGSILQQRLTSRNVQIRKEVSIPIIAGAPIHIDAGSEMRFLLDWNNTGMYREHLDSKLGPKLASEAMQLYLRPDTNHWQQFSSMLSDLRTICPLLRMTSNYFPSDKAYFYIVTHKSRTQLGNLATANADIKAIFGSSNPRSYKDKKYTENIASMFFNFVRTGSITELPVSRNKIFILNDKITKVNEYPNCEFWARNLFLRDLQQNETTN